MTYLLAVQKSKIVYYNNSNFLFDNSAIDEMLDQMKREPLSY